MNLLLIKALYHRHVVQSTNSIFLQALTPKKKKGILYTLLIALFMILATSNFQTHILQQNQ